MKIILLDQPVKNRGDEAAHKSLLRRLVASYGKECQVTCLFRGIDEDTVRQMSVVSPQITYVVLKDWPGYRRVREWIVKNKSMFVESLFPFNKEFKNLINTADAIVVSPGGMNLGGFKTWNHLFLLLLCLKQKKRIIYYSRSIGPFYYEKKYDQLFSQESIKVLKSVDFLSLRDKKSCKIADENHIPYYPSIDTAFLDIPSSEIPIEIARNLPEKYFVFVPNELVWHPAFKNVSREKLIDIYLSIIDVVCKKNDMEIVMLPQLFNAANNDIQFFKEIKALSKYKNRIHVIPDIYNSDIQQAIVSKSRFVIGGRYHSIVFAINNHIPFISLSYEHKMDGLLDSLGLTNRSVPFASLSDIEKFDSKIVSELIEEKSIVDVLTAQQTAHNIAIKTFEKAFNGI